MERLASKLQKSSRRVKVGANGESENCFLQIDLHDLQAVKRPGHNIHHLNHSPPAVPTMSIIWSARGCMVTGELLFFLSNKRFADLRFA